MFDLRKGLPEAIAAITDTNVRASLCKYLMARLSREFENATDKAEKKKISNYKSSVAMFSEFVSGEEDEEPAAEAITSFLPEVTLPSESIYGRKDLIRIFKSRLVTQDRYYYGDNSCFPARIINRIDRRMIEYSTNKPCVDK